MLGFIKALAARTRLFAEEAGQNLVETALIIGVISVVIVGAFMTTNVQAGVADAAEKVVCVARQGQWTAAASSGTTGTCAPK